MKNLFFIIIIQFIIGCNNVDKEIVSKNETRKISYILEKTPFSSETTKNVFTWGTDNKVYESSFTQLKTLYNDKYKNKYKRFDMFLYYALNQKLKLSFTNEVKYSYFYKCFELKTDITELYEKNKITGIINKYCFFDKNKSGYQVVDSVKSNSINTISYYFFINKFYKYEDDYSGKIWYRQFNE